MLQHLKAIVHAVQLPVSADFEACFAVEPGDVYNNVSLALKTGICGVSIEDATRNKNPPLFDLPIARERVRAARQAIYDFGKPVVLTARYEGLLLGVGDVNDAKERLIAYAAAGADCLYAPGVRADSEIDSIVRVAPKAANVLVSANFTSVEKLAPSVCAGSASEAVSRDTRGCRFWKQREVSPIRAASPVRRIGHERYAQQSARRRKAFLIAVQEGRPGGVLFTEIGWIAVGTSSSDARDPHSTPLDATILYKRFATGDP